MDPIFEGESPRGRLALPLRRFFGRALAHHLSASGGPAVCATIAGCDGFDDIVAWGEHHLDFLRQFSNFHHCIPCERWLHSLLNRIDPLLFGCCFTNWVASLWPGRHDFIAIDGKTSRRAHERRRAAGSQGSR